MTGPELQALRQSLGLTQKQLAARLGIHERQVQRKEAGDVRVNKRDEIAIESIRREATEK